LRNRREWMRPYYISKNCFGRSVRRNRQHAVAAVGSWTQVGVMMMIMVVVGVTVSRRQGRHDFIQGQLWRIHAQKDNRRLLSLLLLFRWRGLTWILLFSGFDERLGQLTPEMTRCQIVSRHHGSQDPLPLMLLLLLYG
jgi:hypothetical protein